MGVVGVGVGWVVVEVRGWCVLTKAAIIQRMPGQDLILGRDVLSHLHYQGERVRLL